MSEGDNASPARSVKGSLLIVGTGITGVGQITLEALYAIEQAEQLYYIANDGITEAWLKDRNPSAQTLSDLYGESKSRQRSYVEMATRVVVAVRKGLRVCVAIYGHPGMFVQFTHVAIRALRRQGYQARMLPGVSSDGCLVADLGFNPGDHGLQSFEASDFLMFRRRYDSTSALVLWQIGVLGEPDTGRTQRRQPERLQALVRTLALRYPERHMIVIYQANTFPTDPPLINRLALKRLPLMRISPNATLFVPPLKQRSPNARVKRWFRRPSSD
jgi:hypothetical protein